MKSMFSVKGLRSTLFSSLSIAIFSVPEGMAYAKLAGVNPIYGLFSSVVPTVMAALTTETVLMISTVTSAIAISTRSVMDVAEIAPHEVSDALFALSFLMGVFMLLLGIFRLGKIVNYISSAVMTGFVMGAAFLILVGELGDLVGLNIVAHNKFEHIIYWISHVKDWDLPTSLVGFTSLALMLLLQRIGSLREAASVIVLCAMSGVIYYFEITSVALVGSIATISSAIPSFAVPDVTLMPRMAVGAVSVALVALFQGAGISSAYPNKGGKKEDPSRDFIGVGLGNLCGSFFQAMGTGGSLSRTAISVQSGSTTRWTGFFSGFWLLVLLYSIGSLLKYIPLATIAGILAVISVRIILAKATDFKLIFQASIESGLIMMTTFLLALFIPLQWTIFVGAFLSVLFYFYTSASEGSLVQLVKDKEGYFEDSPLPKVFPSKAVTILEFRGKLFFAVVPAVKKMVPSHERVEGATIIWRMRGQESLSSNFLKWMEGFIRNLQEGGNRFILEGVEQKAMKVLQETEIFKLLGEKNIFPASPAHEKSLNEAYQDALKKSSLSSSIKGDN